MAHHFQVNLRGIIELLSNHLYSGPEVFVRELLQNAVDAIRARERIEPGFAGEINLELTKGKGGAPSTLVVSENGIGLTEEEIHKFLATIGESSKKRVSGDAPSDFIGQFGIGLLSCFMVSEEIVVVTRSAKGDSPAIEWRGKADGTYSVKPLDLDIEPGTQVYLTCKLGSEEFYERERLETLVSKFGGLLPYPIRVRAAKSVHHVNAEPPPWRREFASARERSRALLAYGREAFGGKFFDAVPIQLEAQGLSGVALILNAAPTTAAMDRSEHRIYLKNMYLSDKAHGLVPPWAFFVRLVLDATKLKPTASREGFRDDDALEAAREALSARLKDYLVDLSENDPDKLAKLISLHDLSIRALAVEDDEFFRIVFDWLPVETSRGHMTLGDYRSRHDVLRYAPTMDQFHQIAQVAAAQGICVINGSYTYMIELLQKYPHVFEDGRTERIEARDVTESFRDLDDLEEKAAERFAARAESVLRPFRCHAEVRRFAPADMPALYTTSVEGDFQREIERTEEISDALWSSLMSGLAPKASLDFAQICFNFDNPLVRGLIGVEDETVGRRSIEMLYVQALMMGRHPLNAKELALFNEGLLGLIELALKAGSPSL